MREANRRLSEIALLNELSFRWFEAINSPNSSREDVWRVFCKIHP